jgi:uncharacterized repeat protein (TIGR04076 family)
LSLFRDNDIHQWFLDICSLPSYNSSIPLYLEREDDHKYQKRGDSLFKVKTSVVDFLGDKERYPCHHQYQLGDEFIFDGACFIGGICPSLALTVVPRMMEIHAAGPRFKDYIHYYPFLYAPDSIDDTEAKKTDGLGYKNIFQNSPVPKYHVANLASSGKFKWPPEKRITHRDVRLICPDYRTSVVVKIEAFDIADKGRNIPFYRREMALLDKILKQPGIQAERLLNQFSKQQIEDIYPALSQPMVDSLLEEMELMGYLEIREGNVFASPKAETKIRDFKAALDTDEKTALGW